MGNSKFAGLVAVLTAGALALSACSSSKPADQKTDAKPAVGAAASTGSFYGAWPYDLPPKSHFNYWATAGCLCMGGSPYLDLMLPPLSMYYWGNDTWEPLMAEKWTVDEKALTITVNLRKGVKWSDGSDFKAQDMLTTMTFEKANAGSVWRYVSDVKATDDYTLVFKLIKPAPLALRYVLKERPTPTSVYGEYAKKVQALFDAGKDSKAQEVKDAMKELDGFRPKDFVVSGPYQIDATSMNESQFTMKKVATSYFANNAKFDNIVIYNGETAQVTPLVLDKKVDFATHAFPPATEKQILAQNIRVVRYPFYSGPALFFNNDIYPLNVPQFRQALAYAINRDEAGTVALSKSGVGVKYMTGMSDNLVTTWMTPDAVKKLNPYSYDPKKAEELLKGLHFTKGADGFWVDDKGKQLNFEVHVPSDYSDWSAGADSVVQQLNKFGIKAAVRGVPSSQAPQDINNGNFQIGFRLYGSSIPHPSAAFAADLTTYNSLQLNNQKDKPGQDFPLKQHWSGGDIDFNQAITDMGATMDKAKQQELISNTALAFNELLPVVPLFERYSNSPALENVHVAGWPADNDPILKNSGADPFVAMMILTGKLAPAAKK